MRRALLLASLLAAPLLARAQTGLPPAGQIYFVPTDADLAPKTINIAECKSAATLVKLSWTPTVSQSSGTITYQVYASNKDTSNKTIFTGLGDPNLQCPTESDSSTTNTIKVVKVGTLMTNPALTQSFSTSQIAQALVTSTVTDPCTLTGNTDIFLCIQGQVGGTNFGTSRGKMSLAMTTPDAAPQLLLPISPGNEALTPRWADPAKNTQSYTIQAISVRDPTNPPTAADFDPSSSYGGFDPADGGRHSTGFVSGTQARIGGLKNGVAYAVMITSYTADYNPGTPSNIAIGTPQLTTDFWQTYKNAGGQETGGCASGLAGPLALAAVASALALARRRK